VNSESYVCRHDCLAARFSLPKGSKQPRAYAEGLGLTRSHGPEIVQKGDPMSRKQTPQLPPIPKSKNLLTIPEAAVELCTTVFAVRRLCQSGELRYSQPGHPMLISPQAIKDCVRVMEAKSQIKRELKTAFQVARREKLRALKASRIPAPHTLPCTIKRCCDCARERGRQQAIEMMQQAKLISNG
jgi:hypothetical protein